MGGGRWNSDEWDSYTTSKGYATKSTEAIYTSRKMHDDLDPKGVKFRESRDSEDNPKSSAVIVGLDVTGSMSSVLDAMARTGLNTLVTNIYDRKPVEDPHVMCMGIGDVEMGDRAPLQITQFEADIRIAKQLENIWLEGGGGGNNCESYTLAWYFAAMHTHIDCFQKRGKKGYIFTVGDEMPASILRASEIESVTGFNPERDFTCEELFEMVSRQYEVYHLIVEEGFNYMYRPDKTVRAWTQILGQRAIKLSDHTKMGEVIISTMQVNEGEDHNKIVDSWDGDTSLVVKRAIGDMVDITTVGEDTGVIEF